MKKFNVITLIGLLVIVAHILVDRYVAAIPDIIAIPVLLVGIAVALIGIAKGSGRQPVK